MRVTKKVLDVSTDKVYLATEGDDAVGLFMRMSYYGSRYRCQSIKQEFTTANSYPAVDSDTLAGSIERWLESRSDRDVLEFDSFIGMAKFLCTQ